MGWEGMRSKKTRHNRPAFVSEIKGGGVCFYANIYTYAHCCFCAGLSGMVCFTRCLWCVQHTSHYLFFFPLGMLCVSMMQYSLWPLEVWVPICFVPSVWVWGCICLCMDVCQKLLCLSVSIGVPCESWRPHGDSSSLKLAWGAGKRTPPGLLLFLTCAVQALSSEQPSILIYFVN